MKKLFRGAVVVIDDEVGIEVTDKTDINKLTANIINKGYPCATHKDIPKNIDAFVGHLHSVAFLILDWELNPIEGRDEDPELAAVTIPEAEGKRSLELLKKIKETVFLPVFIFTNTSVEDVIAALVADGLYDAENEGQNFIFVKNKEDLLGEKLFTEIEAWLKKSPSVYVLKEWEREYQNAKSGMFLDFFEKSPAWARVLWKVYKKDGDPASLGLGELISNNLHTRMSPFDFDHKIIHSTDLDVEPKVIRNVLEGERYIGHDKLHEKSICPGDVFASKNKDWPYFVNIRASCDTIREGNPELYLLKGRELVSLNAEDFRNNTYIEKVNQFIIPCLLQGKVIEFAFKDLSILKWKEMEEARLGRLLNPYTQRLQQKYGSYMQRQGTPGTPWEAFFDEKPTTT